MNFVRSARYTVAVSLLILLVGLVSLVWQGLNLGIDFSGGTRFHVAVGAGVSAADLRAAVGSVVDAQPMVQALVDEPGQFTIRMPPLSDEKRDEVLAVLKEQFGVGELLGAEEVQPAISRELTRNALFAIGLAVAVQVIYIALRFDLRFGVSAVAAVAHDAIITLGLVSLLRIEAGAAFVAAVLTIIGYSMNDTIVVFDRIRENIKLRRRGDSLADTVNKSINETLVRSINTTLTTLVPLAAIAVFGGETLRGFAITLFIGIAVGAYSSIFFASPLWLWWTQSSRAAGRS